MGVNKKTIMYAGLLTSSIVILLMGCSNTVTNKENVTNGVEEVSKTKETIDELKSNRDYGLYLGISPKGEIVELDIIYELYNNRLLDGENRVPKDYKERYKTLNIEEFNIYNVYTYPLDKYEEDTLGHSDVIKFTKDQEEHYKIVKEYINVMRNNTALIEEISKNKDNKKDLAIAEKNLKINLEKMIELKKGVKEKYMKDIYVGL